MSKNLSVLTFIARRFLLSRSSDGFLSFISWVSVLGVALGVTALIVVTSVINGFEGEFTRVITSVNGDVVMYSRGNAIRNPKAIEKKIKQVVPEAEEVTASFVTELMAAGPDGVSGAAIEGFDARTFGGVTEIPRRLVWGRMPEKEDEVVLGKALAEKIGAVEGIKIRLIAPFIGSGKVSAAFQNTPKVKKAVVVGAVSIGMHEYDSRFVYAPIDSVRKFLNHPGRVTSFKLKLPKHVDSRRAAIDLNENFGYPFRAKNWAMLHRNLFYAIKLEKAVITIIMTAIVLVAAFNVVSTLMMMIHDKVKELSILKAMGLKRSQGFTLFCAIGLGIGIVGVIGGIGLGLVLNELIANTRLVDLPADVYHISHLPVVVHWPEIAVIAGFAILISFLATVYPSLNASYRSALDGLRYE